METTTHKSSAKDFFLQLGAVITLYWATGQVLNLLLIVINKAFPKINEYSIFGNSSSISFPVASLIVVFPLYIFLSYVIEKECIANPEKRELSVRKWLIYITLFLSAGTLAGSLIYVIYLFLDGQDVTVAFLLKVLAWVVVSGMIFGYYLADIRDKHTNQSRKVWAGAAGMFIVGSIILGFLVIGSPRNQRLEKFDLQKVQDLQNIQAEVISYWDVNAKLPANLEEANKLGYSYVSLIDQQLNTPYEYQMVGTNSFKLCTTFNLKSNAEMYKGRDSHWSHEAGKVCFDRVLEEKIYPVNRLMPTQGL